MKNSRQVGSRAAVVARSTCTSTQLQAWKFTIYQKITCTCKIQNINNPLPNCGVVNSKLVSTTCKYRDTSFLQRALAREITVFSMI